MNRKNFIVLSLVLFLSVCSTIPVYAEGIKATKLKDAVFVAEQYEGNIIFLLTGGYWEAPMEDSEFEPDAPLGVYVNTEASHEVIDKYAMYQQLILEAGILDSGVSSEDVEEYALTQEEKLSLSDVEFSYYYDYNNDYLLQWYEISWVDGSFTRGYVIWINNSVFSVVKF